MRILHLLLATSFIAAGLCAYTTPAAAQDSAATEIIDEEALAKEQQAADAEAKKHADELNAKMRALVESLDNADKKHFYLIYNNHNIISTVQTVKQDIGNAVTACGENNPKMKEEIQNRFQVWTKAVDEKIAEAQAFIDNMITVQDYTDKKNIKNILQTADDLREATAKKFKKVPVTSEEACTFLLNKMAETQDTMVTLLDKTLMTGPMMMEAPENKEPETQEQDDKDDSADDNSGEK